MRSTPPAPSAPRANVLSEPSEILQFCGPNCSTKVVQSEGSVGAVGSGPSGWIIAAIGDGLTSSAAAVAVGAGLGEGVIFGVVAG